MLLWLVEQKRPVKVDRTKDFVMDSAFNYLQGEVKLRYNPSKLLVDSGAYTFARKGIDISPYIIIDIQERLKADVAIPLDYPFMPGMSLLEMRKNWKRTIENLKLWNDVMSSKIEVMPVVHALSKRHLMETVRIISTICDRSNLVGIGTIVDPSFELKGFLGDRQPRIETLEMIIKAIEVIRSFGFKVHLTGFGSSPLMLHLAIYLGADSTDSSGFRRKAAYGKIILPTTGERYVGHGHARFGVVNLSRSEMKYLHEICDCPVCKRDPSLLWRSWKARAIHNEQVIKKTWKLGLKLRNRGLDVYEQYLDSIFARSSLKHLWRYVKIRAKYKRLTDF